VLAGCVPVIIQLHVFQPFEELLDYSQFSIRLPRWASAPGLCGCDQLMCAAKPWGLWGSMRNCACMLVEHWPLASQHHQ
jgi:hypothetical protein